MLLVSAAFAIVLCLCDFSRINPFHFLCKFVVHCKDQWRIEGRGWPPLKTFMLMILLLPSPIAPSWKPALASVRSLQLHACSPFHCWFFYLYCTEYWNCKKSNYIIGHIRILGIGLELACKWGWCRGFFSNANDMNLFLMIFPRMSLHSKLVPVQYREYEYGLMPKLPHINFGYMRIVSMVIQV